MTRADDASIVQAIISLAHSLRLKVVAEGVETPEQLDSLKSMGCDQYQGFHFSPPLPAADFGALMRRRRIGRASHRRIRSSPRRGLTSRPQRQRPPTLEEHRVHPHVENRTRHSARYGEAT